MLGVGWHVVYLCSKSIAAPVILHLVHNALVFSIVSGNPESFPFRGYALGEQGEVVHIPLFLVLAALLAVVALCVLFCQTRVQWRTAGGEIWSPGFLSAESSPSEVEATRESIRPSRAAVVVAMLGFVSGCCSRCFARLRGDEASRSGCGRAASHRQKQRRLFSVLCRRFHHQPQVRHRPIHPRLPRSHVSLQ